ncbi:AraC family transcriptional regulator [Tichowtungia aerotolerans]|uniref:AraC family transcriptional regulator n=1 Tax=Tichowtungia aerotolerans TaxID=2697043 RepID=A0A6P1M5E2_9BACT|nr:AraC family transcriptional regulator [Tichowtungia aerotolerans]QHI69800.1 AraC family transcriptional regulator [Tichowtungia aerotolerans]
MRLRYAFKIDVEKGSDAASDHIHRAVEIVYFLAGTGTTTIDGQTYNVQSNCFSVIPSHVVHNQISETTITSICLCISDCDLKSSQGLWVDATGEIKGCLQKLMQELTTQRTGYSQISEGYLLAAIGLIKRAIKENVPQDRKQALVSQALNIIEEKAGNLSIDEVAGQLFVSKDYLRHLFKHYMGQSPMKTIVSVRIDHAKKLLMNPELNIVEIADQCGFEDPYYFSRLFKSYTGKSPSAFRK